MDAFAIFQPEYLEQLEHEQEVISGIVKQFQKLVSHVKEFAEELGQKLEVDYENYTPGQTVSLQQRQRRQSTFWMPNFTAITRREENLMAQINKNGGNTKRKSTVPLTGVQRKREKRRKKRRKKRGNVGDQQTSMGPCTRTFSLVHWTQFCFAFTNLPSERL